MDSISPVYRSHLSQVLRSNSLLLFDLDGTAMSLNYERHVSPDDFDEPVSIADCIQLTIDLWLSWEIHLAKSRYERPHFGAVHVEERWMTSLNGAPPCVILANERFWGDDEQGMIFPLVFQWRGERLLGGVVCRELQLEDVGRCFRIMLASSFAH
jgi:hypothetical protein